MHLKDAPPAVAIDPSVNTKFHGQLILAGDGYLMDEDLPEDKRLVFIDHPSGQQIQIPMSFYYFRDAYNRLTKPSGQEIMHMRVYQIAQLELFDLISQYGKDLVERMMLGRHRMSILLNSKAADPAFLRTADHIAATTKERGGYVHGWVASRVKDEAFVLLTRADSIHYMQHSEIELVLGDETTEICVDNDLIEMRGRRFAGSELDHDRLIAHGRLRDMTQAFIDRTGVSVNFADYRDSAIARFFATADLEDLLKHHHSIESEIYVRNNNRIYGRSGGAIGKNKKAERDLSGNVASLADGRDRDLWWFVPESMQDELELEYNGHVSKARSLSDVYRHFRERNQEHWQSVAERLDSQERSFLSTPDGWIDRIRDWKWRFLDFIDRIREKISKD